MIKKRLVSNYRFLCLIINKKSQNCHKKFAFISVFSYYSLLTNFGYKYKDKQSRIHFLYFYHEEVNEMKSVISMKDVSWRREGKEILSNINWEVTKGEHWAVLGLNGSGKTTLLNMVNGYIWPTTGKVAVLGEVFGKTDIYSLRKKIGWVSSSLGERVNGRHKVEDLVVSGKFAAVGLMFAEPNDEDFIRAKEIMEQMNVAHTYGQSYEKCSHGEKQKLLIARALMANPQLLILDEPTNGLDFVAREELLNTVARLANSENGPTIIFVTHHIEEVIPVFSHTLLLKDGTVFAKGKREEVITNELMSELYGRSINVQWKQERAFMSFV